MNIAALLLGNTMLAAGLSLFDKLYRSRTSASIAAASFGIVGLPVGLAGLLLFRPSSFWVTVMGVGAGFLYFFVILGYFQIVEAVDASRVATLLRLTTVQASILAVIVLDEHLTALQWGALLLLACSGAVLIVQRTGDGRYVSVPALLLVPLTTLLALETTVMAHLYRTESVGLGVTLENLGLGLGWGSSFLFRHVLATTPVERVRFQGMAVLLTQQTLRLITTLIPAWAIAEGMPVAVVSGIGDIRPVCIFLLEFLLVSSTRTRTDVTAKVIGIGLMGVGLILLRV